MHLQPRKFPPENYKVIYFNVKALAEPLRYLLSYGGIEFEDIRITRDEWPALKASKIKNILYKKDIIIHDQIIIIDR